MQPGIAAFEIGLQRPRCFYGQKPSVQRIIFVEAPQVVGPCAPCFLRTLLAALHDPKVCAADVSDMVTGALDVWLVR
jgi:hypothetical protein